MSATIEIQDGIALVEFSGFVTTETLIRVHRQADLLEGSYAVVAFIAFLDMCVCAFADDSLARGLDAAGVAAHLRGAFVVPAHLKDMMIQHAWCAASEGVQRRVFTSRAAALEWARGLPAREDQHDLLPYG